MTFDQQRLRQVAPFVLPVIILLAGWVFLIRPASVESARAARQLEALRPRLDSVRRALTLPPPPEVAIEPAASFERQVTSGDPGRILEELSRLASPGRYRNLSIDATGEPGVLSAAPGPQVAGDAVPDPRLSLFAIGLSYVPVTMSFETDYAGAGELLWRLRDLGTLVEVRTVSIKRVGAGDAETAAGGVGASPALPRDDVHVTLTLFAYARVPAVARAGSQPGALR